MKKFTLRTVEKLIEQSLREEPTGDAFIDARYQEQVSIIGHTNPYYRLFYLLAKELQPALVVELGSWQATGAAHFASGNPTGHVITIDIHKDDKNAQQRAVEAVTHYPNLQYLNMWTWDAAPHIPPNIDILFIDAWHDYQYVSREWELYRPLLADPALVICDDITTDFNFEGMLRFWDELPGDKILDSRVHPGIPMGFLYVGADREPDPVVKPAAIRRVARKPGKKPRAA